MTSKQSYRFNCSTLRRIHKYQKTVLWLVICILLEIVFMIVLATLCYSCRPRDEVLIDPTVHIESVMEVSEEYEDVSNFKYPYIVLTDEETKDMATLVFLESGAESYECMCGVASVIINRMVIENKSFEEVAYQTGQFDPAYLIPYYEPSEASIYAVEYVSHLGPTIPPYVTYFRADHYHDWGARYIPYESIDNTYFSYDSILKDSWENEYAF